MVQGELFREVPGQLALRVELGQSCSAGFLSGAGVLVVGGVERVYGLAGQEPRCWRRSVMPRTTDSIQPSLRRVPSILLLPTVHLSSFVTDFAPCPFWHGWVSAVPAPARFPGDLQLLPLVLPFVFLSLRGLSSCALVFPAVRLRLAALDPASFLDFVTPELPSGFALVAAFEFPVCGAGFPPFRCTRTGVDGVLLSGSYLPLNLPGSGMRSWKVASFTRLRGNDGESGDNCLFQS